MPVVVCALCVLPAAGQDQADEQGQLDRLLTAYFTEPQQRQRARIGAQVAELVDSDVNEVTRAMGRVRLWPDQAAGLSRFELETAEQQITQVHVLLPEGYDATRPYPLALALHGMSGRGRDILLYLRRLLGDRVDQFIIAAPTDYRGTWFISTPDEAGEPIALLKELRRRYHIDTDRVYAVGFSMGGHAAFTLATLYTDEFASVVAVAGTLAVPYKQMGSILMPNLVNMPLLAVWGENDRFDDAGKPVAGGGIAGINQHLMNLAAEMNLPFNGVEQPGVGHSNATIPVDLLHNFLQMRRDPAPSDICHWFRYPVQGRCDWLRQVVFRGRPWVGTQLSIVTRRPKDLDQHVRNTIEGKLAFIGGRIDEQHIEVTTRRTNQLHVLLNDALIDLDQPITLKVDGKIRFEGKVRRKISTLLETAYADWDFQRLYSVRLVSGRRSRARQN